MRNPFASRPHKAAGNIPTAVKTENLPPTFAGIHKHAWPSRFAHVCSGPSPGLAITVTCEFFIHEGSTAFKRSTHARVSRVLPLFETIMIWRSLQAADFKSPKRRKL